MYAPKQIDTHTHHGTLKALFVCACSCEYSAMLLFIEAVTSVITLSEEQETPLISLLWRMVFVTLRLMEAVAPVSVVG